MDIIKDYSQNVIAKVEEKRNEVRKEVKRKFRFTDDAEKLLKKYDQLLLDCYRTLEQLMSQNK